jgi:hypothetical protein
MKFKRLIDNKPAYTAGKEYTVLEIEDGRDFRRYRIENDMGSSFNYYVDDYRQSAGNNYYCWFHEIWEEV